MSTPFYDLASLVVVPSGYKAAKVYAQKPLTTDGQLTFTRASTATRVNASGLIETVASGVPRLDYLGSSCPKILLEPQRSNLVTWSEALDNAAWVKTNTTVTANAAVSPDGSTNADKLIATSTNALHICESNLISFTSGTAYTFSFYAKRAENNFVQFTGSSSLLSIRANYNLLNGTLGTVDSGISATITSVGSDWYRCTATFTSSVTGSFRVIISSITSSTAGRFQTFAGDGTSGVLLYGAQIEAGAYATSYIPTLSTSVTRVADLASKTGISSLIGQTEGTLFVEANLTQVEDVNLRGILELNDGTTTSRISVYRDTSTTAQVAVFNSGTGSVFMGFNTASKVKIAFKYSAAGITLYVNGSFVATDTSVSIPTCSRLDVGSITQLASRTLGDTISQVLLFKTQLTNAQLAELTAL